MNTVQYKCPNCGAELTFDPEHQNFSCEFCDSTYTEAEMQQLYQNMEQQADQQGSHPPVGDNEQWGDDIPF